MALVRRIAPALVLAGVVGALACGKSKEEQAFDAIARDCDSLVAQHATVRDADQLFLSSPFVPVFDPCRTDFAPLPGGNDVCGGPPTAVCPVTWFWVARDPSLCSPEGWCCYFCETRVTQATQQPDPFQAPLCASHFFRKQPCPVF